VVGGNDEMVHLKSVALYIILRPASTGGGTSHRIQGYRGYTAEFCFRAIVIKACRSPTALHTSTDQDRYPRQESSLVQACGAELHTGLMPTEIAHRLST
jgi:hypothetical protein